MVKPVDTVVFVVPGDLTRLALDAWLLPTDSRIVIRPY